MVKWFDHSTAVATWPLHPVPVLASEFTAVATTTTATSLLGFLYPDKEIIVASGQKSVSKGRLGPNHSLFAFIVRILSPRGRFFKRQY